MLYAAVIVCTLSGCTPYQDAWGPYETAEACEARLHEMRGFFARSMQGAPGLTMQAICGPLDEVRRLIPGAFADVVEGVEV